MKHPFLLHLHRALKKLEKQDSSLKGKNICVSLSGGADSVAVLLGLKHFQKRFGYHLSALHINFRLRGEESDEDERFCESLTEALGVSLQIRRLKKPSQKTGIQNWARQKRFEIYRQFRRKAGVEFFALGHHRNDQIETILFQIFREGRIHPMRGLERFGEFCLFRPLLEIEKETILSFLETMGQNYRIDSSNLSGEYTRNRIRNEVIPLLERVFGKERLSKSFLVLLEENEKYEELKSWFHRMIDLSDQERLDLRKLSHERRLRDIQLSSWLSGRGILPRKKTIEPLMRIMEKGSGEVILSPDKKLVVESSFLKMVSSERTKKKKSSLIEVKPSGETKFWGGKLLVKPLKKKPRQLKTSKKDEVILDAAKIEGRLKVRSRKPGDRFVPLGSEQLVKLKDFLINEKVPRSEREEIPILVDREKIVWVVGLRLDDRVKVDKNTTSFLKIMYRR